MDAFTLMRWAVLALAVAIVALMWMRRRAFADAPILWRLLGVGLLLHLIATSIGTADALATGRSGGGQVPSYLIALLVIVYALARRPKTISDKEY